jgi:hypothetical protein
MNIRNEVELLPNTARLKQLRKEFGPVWIMVALPEPMQCFNGDKGMRIQSRDGKHVRNARLTDVEVIK